MKLYGDYKVSFAVTLAKNGSDSDKVTCWYEGVCATRNLKDIINRVDWTDGQRHTIRECIAAMYEIPVERVEVGSLY